MIRDARLSFFNSIVLLLQSGSNAEREPEPEPQHEYTAAGRALKEK